jgi:hypothetical protein
MKLIHAQYGDEGEIRLVDVQCECEKPEFNDTYWDMIFKKSCIHCDVCGGVP